MFGMGTGGPSAIKTPTVSVFRGLFCISDELSSRLVSKQVLSPQQSLTSVFGMGTGGPSAIISLIYLTLEKERKDELKRNSNYSKEPRSDDSETSLRRFKPSVY